MKCEQCGTMVVVNGPHHAVWHPRLWDVEWLRAQYVDASRSTKHIAAEVGCSHTAVGAALRRSGIPLRPRGSYKSRTFASEVSADRLRALYVDEGLSCSGVAARLGVTTMTVHRALVQYGIPRRRIGTYDRHRAKVAA